MKAQKKWGIKYNSLSDLFLAQAKRKGDREFLRFKRNGRWISLSWVDALDDVRNFGVGLYVLGIRKKDRVCILSENRPEWVISDLSIKSIGAVTVPIHISKSAEEIAQNIGNAEAKIVVVSGNDLLEKVLADRNIVSKLMAIVVMDTKGSKIDGKILDFECVLEKGRQNTRLSIRAKQFQVCKGSDVASIIYTSGTTGEPRGVMLTHDNFLSNIMAANEAMSLSEDATYLLILPVSHVFELLVGVYKNIFNGVKISFSSGVENLVQDFKEIRPNVACVVPRILEKIHIRLWDSVRQGNFIRRFVFLWAIGVGEKVSEKICKGEKVSIWLSFKRSLADIFVFRWIRRRFGGRLNFLISGGAPLPINIAKFFHAIGVLVLEGYGLTETSPIIATNIPEENKFGTVGKPLCNLKVQVSKDGEILVKGPSVMRGYFKDQEATRTAIDSFGWLHTGDLGRFDEDGFLVITGRKKEMIILSTAKKVVPQFVENLLKEDVFIEQAVVFGEGQSYIVALIVPDFALLFRLAKEKGFGDLGIKELVNLDFVHKNVSDRVEQVNSRVANHEQIRCFTILPHMLTEEAGELTSTLKIKRKVVEKKYGHLIKPLYSHTISDVRLGIKIA